MRMGFGSTSYRRHGKTAVESTHYGGTQISEDRGACCGKIVAHITLKAKFSLLGEGILTCLPGHNQNCIVRQVGINQEHAHEDLRFLYLLFISH